MWLILILLVAVLVFVGIVWFFVSPTNAEPTTRPGAPSASGPQRVSPPPAVELPPDAVDLRGIECTRMRVKGTVYYVADSKRQTAGAPAFILTREPKNRHDANAIRINDPSGKKLGYVAASRAGLLAPLLDELKAPSYIVGGTVATDRDIRLWVDLPRVPALRKFVKASAK